MAWLSRPLTVIGLVILAHGYDICAFILFFFSLSCLLGMHMWLHDTKMMPDVTLRMSTQSSHPPQYSIPHHRRQLLYLWTFTSKLLRQLF